jgi:hypothetical protein
LNNLKLRKESKEEREVCMYVSIYVSTLDRLVLEGEGEERGRLEEEEEPRRVSTMIGLDWKEMDEGFFSLLVVLFGSVKERER